LYRHGSIHPITDDSDPRRDAAEGNPSGVIWPSLGLSDVARRYVVFEAGFLPGIAARRSRIFPTWCAMFLRSRGSDGADLPMLMSLAQ
jgi:hypothetical protein